MPKVKTNKSAAKRFSVTGTGKIKYKKRGLRHCLEHVSKDTKRGLGKAGYLDPRDHDGVAKLIPYKF
ncbi:MAG: 50S ribosomal protein L35 [Myxococcota bacterium]